MKNLTLIGSIFTLMAASTIASAGALPSNASLNADEAYLAAEDTQVVIEVSEFSAMETAKEAKDTRGNSLNDDEDFLGNVI